MSIKSMIMMAIFAATSAAAMASDKPAVEARLKMENHGKGKTVPHAKAPVCRAAPIMSPASKPAVEARIKAGH